eukprot:3263978-Prorocentrum_lima.AAC.1
MRSQASLAACLRFSHLSWDMSTSMRFGLPSSTSFTPAAARSAAAVISLVSARFRRASSAAAWRCS